MKRPFALLRESATVTRYFGLCLVPHRERRITTILITPLQGT